MSSSSIHISQSVSDNAAESTFHEVDDLERAIPAIEFRNVVLAFDERVILNNLSFKVMKGETKIILGGSGGGKSTIIKLVLGLLKPDSGQVLVDGEDVTNYSENQMMKIRKKIGMVFQEGALFDSLSVYDNVAYRLHEQNVPEDEVEPEVRRMLRFVNLEDAIDKMPIELSGGMRRRAAIARAVVTEPPLQMYDSPTAGLDPITAHTIMALLIKERDVSQATTMLVTQRFQDGNLMANFRYNSEQGALEPARTGDKQKSRTTFMVLKEGRLVFEDDQDAIESSNDPYIIKFVKQRV